MSRHPRKLRLGAQAGVAAPEAAGRPWNRGGTAGFPEEVSQVQGYLE
jgi:hypothetical protein